LKGLGFRVFFFKIYLNFIYPNLAKNKNGYTHPTPAEAKGDKLLSFDPLINPVINKIPINSRFFDNCLVFNFQKKLITYLDDPIIIQVGYQSFNTSTPKTHTHTHTHTHTKSF